MSSVTHASTPIPYLRIVLLVDAATCVAMGLVLALGAGKLAAILGLPVPLIQYSGLVLLPTAAFITWVASRRDPPRWGIQAIIAGNALWIGASLALLVAGWVSPTWIGKGFIAGQALGVALLTVIEYVASREG